ncbi:MAG: hypothetical protein H0V63_03715 [Burkholderiaceae bacterium]|nr:hypothetical protein [Burkholderiaceae bacterium]
MTASRRSWRADRLVIEIGSRTPRQFHVHLDSGDVAAGTFHLGKDRRVIANATTDVNDSIPRFEFERIETQRKEARLAIVQLPTRIDRDQNVVIQMSRVGILSGPIRRSSGLNGSDDLPGAWTEKMLARDLRKCLYQGL